jgi:hypothetical protein
MLHKFNKFALIKENNEAKSKQISLEKKINAVIDILLSPLIEMEVGYTYDVDFKKNEKVDTHNEVHHYATITINSDYGFKHSDRSETNFKSVAQSIFDKLLKLINSKFKESHIMYQYHWRMIGFNLDAYNLLDDGKIVSKWAGNSLKRDKEDVGNLVGGVEIKFKYLTSKMTKNEIYDILTRIYGIEKDSFVFNSEGEPIKFKLTRREFLSTLIKEDSDFDNLINGEDYLGEQLSEMSFDYNWNSNLVYNELTQKQIEKIYDMLNIDMGEYIEDFSGSEEEAFDRMMEENADDLFNNLIDKIRETYVSKTYDWYSDDIEQDYNKGVDKLYDGIAGNWQYGVGEDSDIIEIELTTKSFTTVLANAEANVDDSPFNDLAELIEHMNEDKPLDSYLDSFDITSLSSEESIELNEELDAMIEDYKTKL